MGFEIPSHESSKSAGYQPGPALAIECQVETSSRECQSDGFDYELWLFEQGIRATGYVNNDPRLPDKNVLTDSFVSTSMNWVNRWRSVLRERISPCPAKL